MQPQFERILMNFKKWMPNHAPVWTQVGVKMLGGIDMHFEIEVEAYDAEGATLAAKVRA
jgi:enamine deaminase RidA (YjgF/YER057c/UK114 family)